LRCHAQRAGAFSSQAVSLGDSENTTKQTVAFSSQAVSLGDSENATKQPEAFSSQAVSLGGSENATKPKFSACRLSGCEADRR
jgi:fructose-specific component phosphotransferase system IIB-like protein